ncbi:MAG: exosortase/archaeosortase family protein [Candidatus Auribacter fodinae]|jgi:exosortase|uniref:Exosortase/archaeosortase family protein n=1 Tax=Candidatus Auribacter fodinae TaxID=2093366 RepID=A0A3A4R7I9_9BACT|nr:MAG: exosortase/archaeosortase family protein [Candidatus Auribacter fodinae]
MKKNDLVKLTFICVLLIIAYIPIWQWMYYRFTQTDTYYSHGFLIPFISGFLVWRRRADLKKALWSYSGGTIVFLIMGFVMLFMASAWRFYFLGGLSLLVVLYGLTEYIFGRTIRKIMFFPILFLFFMVPIPEAWIANINLNLKFFATGIAVRFVELFGLALVQEGSRLYLPEGVMTVGDVCSGLRSLISLLAFGSLFAYLCDLPLWKKTFLFLMAFPCAILSNIIRIAALCFVANSYGIPFATGKFHDMSGLGVFVVAFCIMFGIERILSGKKSAKGAA